MGFKEAAAKGASLEKVSMDKMANLGFKVLKNPQKNNIDYDFSAEDDKTNWTFEVKLDLMSNITNNFAIELWNPKLNKPSGLMATKADFWIHGSSTKNIYICSRKSLIKYVSVTTGRFHPSGGDNNADLVLFPKSAMIDILFDNFLSLDLPLFYRLCENL